MYAHNPYRQYKRLPRRAELSEVPFHTLRHTCATILFRRGADPTLLQQLPGHASVKITRAPTATASTASTAAWGTRWTRRWGRFVRLLLTVGG